MLGRTEGSFRPVARESCDHMPGYYVAVDDSATVRLIGSAWRLDGRLQDFFLELQRCSPDDWEWETVMRADICHGHAHTHRVVDGVDSEGDPEHVFRLDALDDVDEGFMRVVGHMTAAGREIVRLQEGTG